MPEQQSYQLYIDVQIRDNRGSGGLSIREDLELPAADFLQIAAILGQFHELAQKFKKDA